MRRPNLTLLASSAILSLAAIVAALWTGASAASETAGPTARSASEEHAPSGPQVAASGESSERAALECLLLEGDGFYALPAGRFFAMRFETRYTTHLRQGEQEQEVEAGFGVQGRLEALVLATREAELAIELRLREPVLAIQASGVTPTPEQLAALSEELARPAVVRLTRDGRTLGYRFDARSRGETRNVLRTLWSALVPVIPDEASASWIADENDASGPCRMAYEWRERFESSSEAPFGQTEARLTRRKISSAGARTSASGAPIEATTELLESLGEVRLCPRRRWPVEASYTEKSRLAVAEAMLALEQEGRSELELIESRDMPPESLPVFDWNGPWDGAAGNHESSSSEGDLRRASLGRDLAGLDAAGLALEIESLLAAGMHDSQELYDAQRALAELIRLDSSALEQLARLLDDPRAADEAVMVVLAAIGMAQSPEAQAFLAAVLGEPTQPEAARVYATWSMFQLDRPGTAVVEAVASAFEARDNPPLVQQSAMLALGALSGKLGGPGSASSLELLFAREKEALDSGELVLWLEALGNSGSPQILPKVRPYLQHADSRIRAAAVSALRLVAAPEATSLLSLACLEDAAFQVRAVAAEYIAPRREELADETIGHVLANDVAALVRRRAIEGLGQRHPLDPVALALLERSAAHDADGEVRSLAQSVLEGAQVP